MTTTERPSPTRRLARTPGPLPAGPAPTVHIRRQRPPMSRKKKIVTFVGLLVALPGIALAATFIWITVTGSTSFTDTTASAAINSVSGTLGTGGVDCRNATQTGAAAIAVNPKGKRVTFAGQGQADPGSCTVQIAVDNTGAVPITLTGALVMPTGWTQNGSPVTITPGGSGTLNITITAAPEATAGAITGSVNVTAAGS